MEKPVSRSPKLNDCAAPDSMIARALAESAYRSSDAVLVGDADGRITWMNQAAERLCGRAASELVGRRLSLFPQDPEANAAAVEHVRARLAEGRMAKLDAQVREGGPHGRWIALEVQPVAGAGETDAEAAGATDGARAGGGFVAVVTDISDRKRLEAALAESEERERALVDGSPEPMAVHADGVVVYLNRAALELLGARDPQQVLGRSVLELVHADYHALVSERILKMEQVGDPAARTEEKLVGIDGRVVDVEMSAAPITWRGSPAIALVARDITERRRVESAQRARDARAHEAERQGSLAALASNVARDFDDLLREILAHSDEALGDVDTDSRTATALKRIRAAALRASGFTRGMLAYAGERRLSLGTLDLSALVLEISQLVEPIVLPGVSVSWDLSGSLPLVEGDRTALREVVTTLLTNATESLRDRRGGIAVRTWLREIGPGPHPYVVPADGVAPGRYVTLEVSDTGCGMDAATHEQIFDPFFSTKLPGRGLGLAAALGVVRAHGGALEVETALGRGTRASILLPASDRPRRIAGRRDRSRAGSAR